MISVEFSEAQLAGLQQLDANLSQAGPKIRRQLIGSLTATVLGYSQQHAQAQTDLSGLPYAPHKRGRKRKMLTRLARRLKITSMSGSEAVIGFRNPKEGEIGYKQQYGATEQFSKTQFKGSYNLKGGDAATRTQAKSLLAAGYKYKPAGKAYRTPTLKWIMENLTINRAGLILRLLRGAAKDAWMTTLPPRSFLGVTPAETDELIKKALEESSAYFADILRNIRAVQ